MTPPLRVRRFTVTSVDSADRARSRRDLNVIRGLGAVLDKRAWWVKWTTRPDVRAKWLREIDAAIVEANVRQVADVWPNGDDVERGEYAVLLAAASASGPNKQELVQKLLDHVQYPPAHADYDGFDHGNYYESDDEWTAFGSEISGDGATDRRGEDAESENYDRSAVDKQFEKVYRHHAKQNAYGQLTWYVMMANVRRRLRALPIERWTPEEVNDLLPPTSEDEDDVKRTIELILAVAHDSRPCSLDVVRSYLPAENQENVLRILALHFQKIIYNLDRTKRDICAVLNMLVKRIEERVKPSDLEGTCIPGPVPQTWLGDNVVPSDIKAALFSEIAALEGVPDETKDWHPNTDNQVLNLVHPSLFCGVIGQTPVVSAGDLTETVLDHLRSILSAPTSGQLTGPPSTQFQWLPSEFDVSGDGNSTVIRSYINNLNPETNAHLYTVIAAIFTRFVPLFDQVLSSLDDSHARTAFRYSAVHNARQNGLPVPGEATKQRLIDDLTIELGGEPPSTSLRRIISPGFFEMDAPRFTLKDSRCQVIAKIAEIILTPENAEYEGGSWHVEGTDAERIIATGIYYFACENVTASRLSFRTLVHEPEYEQSDHVGIGLTYGLKNDEPLIQNLGHVTALEDRCLVFPNVYQHKVEPFQLADPTRPGVRKILAFFLVDPVNGSIPSTAIVPPQQQQWIARASEPELKRLRVQVDEDHHTHHINREGITLGEAKQLRLELMEERSPVDNSDDESECLFSLCEH